MADEIRRGFMVPEQPATPEPRGGLASDPLGGLAKFVGDVNRGLEVVMSNPIYHRLWAGAVSGQANNPMAGPAALAQLQQKDPAKSHLELLREKQLSDTIADSERKRGREERLRQAYASGDQRSIEAALFDADPTGSAQRMTAQKAAPALKQVMTPDGPRYVTAEEALGQTPFTPSLVEVNTGSQGLDLNQVANASRAERASFVEQMKPFESFDRARATLRNVRAMADERGVLPQQASQIIASDAMAALRPEALNEGDVARLTAVGLWNKAYAVLGLPPQMTVEQLDTLAKMIEDKAREAEPKRRALIDDGRFRAQQFGFDPRLILGEYATPQPASQPAPAASQTPANQPPRPVRARPLP